MKEKDPKIYIHLTEKGKKIANWLQIDALKGQKWDGKWRIVIFDISNLTFDCRDEIELLRDFLVCPKRK